jgi:glycosyltransferase involved in cell wall biosynthesis
LANTPKDTSLKIYMLSEMVLELDPSIEIYHININWCKKNILFRVVFEIICIPFILRKYSINLLFCPGGLVLTPKVSGVKIVTMFRNMIPFDKNTLKNSKSYTRKLKNNILNVLMLYSFKKADLVIFISKYAKKVVYDLEEKINGVVIPHGINENFRLEKKPSIDVNSIYGDYILYVSRFDFYKNHIQLIDAYSMLSDEIKYKYVLLLSGEIDSPLYIEVKNKVDSLGLGSRIIFLDEVPYSDLPSYYKMSSLNVFSSSCENCPNILLEMLAAGRPIVCSNIMPMPEFAKESAAYYDPFNSKSITKAISHVLANTQIAKGLGEKALERSKKYDWVDSANKTWAELLKTIKDI